MVQQCPYCLALVGKLYMRCSWCGLYFCEDCIDPHKHNCHAYQEGAEQKIYKMYRADYSSNIYEKFASPDYLEKEPVPELSVEEKEENNREHIVKANLIFKERLRLRIGRSSDRCPSCGNTINRVDEKCSLCGIQFCVYCIEPEKHNCVIYRYEMEKYPVSVKSTKLIVKSAIESEAIKEPTTTPKVIASSTTIGKPINESLSQENQVNNPKEVNVKERTKIERKIPLWRKLLSIFGFGH